MFRELVLVGLLAGCATMQKAEPKFAPGACIELLQKPKEGSLATEKARVIAFDESRYFLFIGAIEAEEGVIVITERAFINEVDKNYKATACDGALVNN